MKSEKWFQKKTRGQKCIAAVGAALAPYMNLGKVVAVLEWKFALTPDDAERILSFPALNASLYRRSRKKPEFQSDLHRLSKTADVLCTRNAGRLISHVNKARTLLKNLSNLSPDMVKRQIPGASTGLIIEHLNKAMHESSRCAATIVECCAPMTKQRAKALLTLEKQPRHPLRHLLHRSK